MKRKITINNIMKQEEIIMKGFIKITLLSTMLIAGLVFAREKAEIDTDVGINHGGKEYIINSSDYSGNSAESREEIILWEEDFERNA